MTINKKLWLLSLKEQPFTSVLLFNHERSTNTSVVYPILDFVFVTLLVVLSIFHSVLVPTDYVFLFFSIVSSW
jgi:hypothetical protein